MLAQTWTEEKQHFYINRGLCQDDFQPGHIYAISAKRFAKYLGPSPSGRTFRVSVLDGSTFDDTETTVRKMWELTPGEDQRIRLYEIKRDAQNGVCQPIDHPSTNQLGSENLVTIWGSEDCNLYRLLRTDEADNLNQIGGIFPKDPLAYMKPEAHVRKTKPRSPAWSSSVDRLVPLWLTQQTRHQDDDVVTIAAIDADDIFGCCLDATALISDRVVVPYNLANCLEEALVYGFASDMSITQMNFSREMLNRLPHQQMAKTKGYKTWKNRLRANHLETIEELCANAGRRARRGDD